MTTSWIVLIDNIDDAQGVKVSKATGLGLYCECVMIIIYNGRVSTINRALDGSTHPGQKLVPSALRKKIVVNKHNNLYFGLIMPSSG
jgi:hypothetical protein